MHLLLLAIIAGRCYAPGDGGLRPRTRPPATSNPTMPCDHQIDEIYKVVYYPGPHAACSIL
jgi:hypothetical protein